MELTEDILELTRKVRRSKSRIIALDGSMDAGKSTFIAPALRIAIGGRVIHLDHYLHRHAGKYFHSLKLTKLKEDIHNTIVKGMPVIIEGLLVTKILRTLHIHPDISIYACDSFWYNQWEEYEHDHEPVKQIIKEEETMTNKIKKAIHPRWKYVHFSHLTKELYEYTHSYRPLDEATYVFIIDKYY
ncbi:MAG: hypothetical protein RI947_856 [Candidatus Parcubacteria bacterium]